MSRIWKVIALVLYKCSGTGRSIDASTQHQMYVLGNRSAGREHASAAGQHIHFIARIGELVETHIDDERYGIDQLCRDANQPFPNTTN